MAGDLRARVRNALNTIAGDISRKKGAMAWVFAESTPASTHRFVCDVDVNCTTELVVKDFARRMEDLCGAGVHARASEKKAALCEPAFQEHHAAAEEARDYVVTCFDVFGLAREPAPAVAGEAPGKESRCGGVLSVLLLLAALLFFIVYIK